MLGPFASVDNPVFVSCRCGLSHKSKLSYEKFLSAFEDNRHAGYGRVTLDTPGKVVTPVVFERHDSLTPEAAINRLRSKISENPETIQRVSVLMSRIASCLYHISKGNLAAKYLKDIVFRKIYNSKTPLMGVHGSASCAMKWLCKRDGTPNALLVVRGDGNLLFHLILSKTVARGTKKYTFTTNKAYTFFPFTSRPTKGCSCLRRLKLIIIVGCKRKQKTVMSLRSFPGFRRVWPRWNGTDIQRGFTSDNQCILFCDVW